MLEGFSDRKNPDSKNYINNELNKIFSEITSSPHTLFTLNIFSLSTGTVRNTKTVLGKNISSDENVQYLKTLI